ncbi:hypothetical protein EVAR_70741_1 [Eumeta japonica]|uniref:Uncharacterized protein n=1 Tax=Eumeta variegata TaxID=151549 RepID=A0A4C2AEI4_EUMVA|nr:hypothetical protein EVAR_70741_1 [Eumeta japonica]
MATGLQRMACVEDGLKKGKCAICKGFGTVCIDLSPISSITALRQTKLGQITLDLSKTDTDGISATPVFGDSTTSLMTYFGVIDVFNLPSGCVRVPCGVGGPGAGGGGASADSAASVPCLDGLQSVAESISKEKLRAESEVRTQIEVENSTGVEIECEIGMRTRSGAGSEPTAKAGLRSLSSLTLVQRGQELRMNAVTNAMTTSMNDELRRSSRDIKSVVSFDQVKI